MPSLSAAFPADLNILARPDGIHLFRGAIHLGSLAALAVHQFLFPLFVSPRLSVSLYSLCAFMLLLDGLLWLFLQESGKPGLRDKTLFVLEALFFFCLALILGPSAAALILPAAFVLISAFSLYGGWRRGAAFALWLSGLVPLAFLLHGFEPGENDQWKALLAFWNFGLLAAVLAGWLLLRAAGARLQRPAAAERFRAAGPAASGSPLAPGIEMSLNLARKKIKPALNFLARNFPDSSGPDTSKKSRFFGKEPYFSPEECKKRLQGLQGFIERFIQFAEPEEPGGPPRILNIKSLLSQALKNLDGHSDRPKNLEISMNCGDAEQTEGSGKLLEKAFENILVNAFQAVKLKGAQRPKINVRAFNEKGWLVLEFWDNGHGILEDDKKKLFDPLFSKSFDELRGLGLAEAQKIIRLHKGSIEAETSAKGTVFRIRLPLVKGKAPLPLSA